MKNKMNAYSNRGQGVILVLYSLNELSGACRRQEVLEFIQRAELYEITRHDLPPYPGHNEPRYHNLLSWARKDSVENHWMLKNGERDAWQLSQVGITLLAKIKNACETGKIDVRQCYLWTPKFKKQMDSKYVPSPQDAVRREDIFGEPSC